MSRAYTEEEVRSALLKQIKFLAQHWARTNEKTTRDKLDGLAFSILNIFDGTSAALPAFDIVVRPHPDDKAFYQAEDENYYEDGMVINDDCYLHELFYKS